MVIGKLDLEMLNKILGYVFEEVDSSGEFADVKMDFWRTFDKEIYKEIEKEIEDFLVQGENFCIYLWCDCSGPDYWIDEFLNWDGNANYICLTFRFENEKKTVCAIEINDIKNAISQGLEKMDELLIWEKFPKNND